METFFIFNFNNILNKGFIQSFFKFKIKKIQQCKNILKIFQKAHHFKIKERKELLFDFYSLFAKKESSKTIKYS